MKMYKRILSFVLVLCMVFSMSFGVLAAEPMTEPEVAVEDSTTAEDETEAAESEAAETETSSETESSTQSEESTEAAVLEDTTEAEAAVVAENRAAVAAETKAAGEFLRIYHLDCGRIYFSAADIKELIDELAKYDYTHMELAFGNGGLRFLLNDMSVSDGTKTYGSDAVKTAIKNGNASFVANDGQGGSSAPNTCLTQSEMDGIISYAAGKGIEIIPLFNTPGHMNAVVYAMAELGIQNAAYTNNGITAKSTIDLTNTKAVTFTQNLVQKYITYFNGKGSTMFNLGADEYANDPSDVSNGTKPLSGFGAMDAATKNNFVGYVNAIAGKISSAGMTPLMFNDGFAWNDVTYNSDIVFCCWENAGIGAAAIASKGYNVINTNKAWYYVMGSPFGTGSGNWCSLAWAQNGTANTSLTTMVDGSTPGNLLMGAMMCTWCDFTSKEYTDAEKDNVKGLIRTLAESNPDRFDLPVTRDITLVQGESITVLENGDLRNVSVNDDYVTVTAGNSYTAQNTKVTAVAGFSGDYLLVNSRNDNRYFNTLLTNEALSSGVKGIDTNSAGANTFEGNYAENIYTFTRLENGNYTIQSKNGKYLRIGTSNGSLSLSDTPCELSVDIVDGKIAIRNGNRYVDDYAEGTVNSWDKGSSPENQNKWYLYKSNGTELTFTGKKEGTTTITVGRVTYNITVEGEDLSQVTLTYHPWISSYAVFPEGTTSGMTGEGVARDVNIRAADYSEIHSEAGKLWSEIAPETGNWQWEGEAQTHFWKGVVLDQGNHQAGNIDKDKSMSGTDFTYIRYWGRQWSYSSDRTTWTDINPTDEVCAYYLQKTAVTTEVDTYVKDWALTPHNSATTSNNSYQKALSFAVVYPDGQMKTEAEIYTDSTLIYYNNLDPLTFIRVAVTSTYEVEKITYTLGARQKATGSADNKWSINDRITWNKVPVSGTDQEWYDETTCWTPESGTEPVVNGADLHNKIYAGTNPGTGYNGTWGRDDAVLILIYLKPVVTEDSLMVRYWDDSTGSEIFNYPINIINESTSEKGTFVNRLEGDEAVPVAGEVLVLSDTAYVVNAAGVNETFEKNLTKIPELRGKYASGLYTYQTADISEDGKTLNLHYSLDTSKLTKKYVIDFGLPLEIPMSELVETVPDSADISISSLFGQAEYDAVTKKIVYTPTEVLTRTEMLTVNLPYSDGDPTITVAIYPATTVFYEESFMKYGNGWTYYGSAPAKQQLEAVGAKVNSYGYDSVYGSTNSSYKLSEGIGNTTSFTFVGTGVGIYTNNTEATGRLAVQVLDASGKVKKMMTINTIMKDGTTSVTENQNINDQSFPSAVIDLGTHGTYTVKINHIKTSSEEMKPLRLDGFRVYNTIDAQSVYSQDGEAYPHYLNLRDALLNGYNVSTVTAENSIYVGEKDGEKYYVEQVYDKSSTGNVVTYVAMDMPENGIQDLLDNGPKNQIYLRAGEGITFHVEGTFDKAQIGLKAIGSTVNAQINDVPTSVQSNTDMFYELSIPVDGNVTISNPVGSTGVLAVTDLKTVRETAGHTVTLSAPAAPAVAAFARSFMMLSLEPEEPEVPVEPETPAQADASLNISVLDWDGNVLADTVLTKTGAEGELAVFTEEEIQAAVEALKLPEGYVLDGAKYYEVQVEYGMNSSFECYASEVIEETADAVLTIVLNDKKGKKLGETQLSYTGVSGEAHTFSKDEIVAAGNALAKECGKKNIETKKCKAVTVNCGESASTTVKVKK